MTLAPYGKSRGCKAGLVGLALLAVFAALIGGASVLTTAFADNDDDNAANACPEGLGYTYEKVDGESGGVNTWIAPAGKIIDQICLKSGMGSFKDPKDPVYQNSANAYPVTENGTYGWGDAQGNQGKANGCYIVTGLGTSEVKVTRRMIFGYLCHDISHVNYYYKDAPISPKPDMKATKVNSVNGLVQEPSGFAWTITLQNIGLGKARFEENTLVFKDDLPTGLVYSLGGLTGSSTTNLNCKLDNTQVTCIVKNNKAFTLQPTESIDLTISVDRTKGLPGEYHNPPSGAICKVDPSDLLDESNEENNACSDTVIVRSASSSNLSITKTPDEATVTTGDPVGFTITVMNTGNADAVNVTVSDPLPAGSPILAWTIDSAKSSLSNCDIIAGILTCSGNTIAKNGGVKKVHITANTAAAQACVSQTIENKATVSQGPVSKDASASIELKCAPTVPPEIEKSMTGTTGQWTITLTNTNAFATSVYISDPEAALSGLPDDCQATGLPQGDATCVIPANSGATGGTLSFTASKVVPAAVCQPQTLSNTAKMWVGSSKGDDMDALSADGGSFPIPAAEEACDKPGITKVANTTNTTDPSAVWWTVTVTNPATGSNGMTQNVKIIDSDADVIEGPTYSGSASCTTSNFEADLNSSDGVSCTMPNTSSITFKVKPAESIVRMCEDQEFSNTAYLSAGTFTDSDGSTITLDKDTDCGRTLTLCKAISDNGDGIDDGGAFPFSLKVSGTSIVPDVTITSHESDTNDEEGANQFPGNCTTVAIPDNYRTASITVAESTAWPAGWNEAPGFPYFTTSASSETVGSSVTIDPAITKVKFYNKNVPLKTRLTLVKTVDTTNGGDAQPDDFKLTIDGKAVSSGVSNEVTPGSHTIGETNLPGYAAGTWTCSDDTTEAGVTVTGGSITLNAGQQVTCTITNTSQKGTIVVKKVNLGGLADQDDSFSGTIGGEAFGGLTPGVPVSKDVAAGTYTVSEDARIGYQYIGWNQPGEGGACETDDIKFSEGDASVSVGIGETETVCLYNQPVGTVILVKNANLLAGGTWNFTGDSLVVGTPSLITSGAAPPDFSHAQETFTNVPSGAYTIAESEGRGRCQPGMGAADFETRVLASIGSEPEPGTSDTASSVTYSVEKGRTTYIVFENVACGTVLDTSSITVTKFNSLDGTRLGGWSFSISGPGISGSRVQTTDDSGSTIFLGLVDGEYTVTEVMQPGWNLVGNTFEGNESTSASRSVALGLGQRKAIGFYNQPAVSIEVTKTEITNIGAHAGAGWEIALKGCGQDRTEKTGRDGTVTWNNLVPCAYTVSEDANSKGVGWVATTPTSVTIAGQDSGTYKVSFTNVYSVTSPPPTTVIEVSPTGTPTETGPTSTLADTPTVTPAPWEAVEEPVGTPTNTSIEETAGEKTPGPGEKTVAGGATPIAPSAGSGAYGTGGRFNILLALFGLASVSAGLAVMALARKDRS